LSAEIQRGKEWRSLASVGVASAPTRNLGRRATVPVGTCPDCEAEVHVDLDADKGDTVTCDECATELEIVGLDPVELDIAEEDIDDGDDLDDEDDY
jgi:alpha-aminoadipate carrier protein LysW